MEPSDVVSCAEVDIIDDIIHENMQHFDVVFEFLTRHSKLKFGSIRSTQVAIEDNDGNCN